MTLSWWTSIPHFRSKGNEEDGESMHFSKVEIDPAGEMGDYE